MQNVAEIYVDGECLFNGTKNARAGIGIWWGDNHPNNISEPLKGRTNNVRAELYAATKGINQAANFNYKGVKVHTNSDFIINCITSNINKWNNNGWLNYHGEPVKNKEDIINLIISINRISVFWVKLETKCRIYGNEQAKKLAIKALEEYESDSN